MERLWLVQSVFLAPNFQQETPFPWAPAKRSQYCNATYCARLTILLRGVGVCWLPFPPGLAYCWLKFETGQFFHATFMERHNFLMWFFIIILCSFSIMCCSCFIMLCGFLIMCCSRFITFCGFFMMSCNAVLTWCVFIMTLCNNFIMWRGFIMMYWGCYVILVTWCGYAAVADLGEGPGGPAPLILGKNRRNDWSKKGQQGKKFKTAPPPPPPPATALLWGVWYLLYVVWSLRDGVWSLIDVVSSWLRDAVSSYFFLASLPIPSSGTQAHSLSRTG